MFWKSKQVGRLIAEVAATADDREEFTRRAREAAAELGRPLIRKSRVYFWSPPPKPSSLDGKYEGIGDWMAVCQSAIFEMWFHLGEVALADLHEVAFGRYDWTQASATEVLCRLALDGVDTERTATRIAEALPKWRYEQIIYVRVPVAALSVRSHALRSAYDSLVETWRERDPVDAFELVLALKHADPTHAFMRYGDFLHALAAGEGLEGRTPYDDGHVVETPDGGLAARSGPTHPLIVDYHSIRAAVLLWELSPGDERIEQRLRRWADEHPDEGVREEMRQILAGE